MVFRSKVDNYFIVIILILLSIVSAAFLLPLLLCHDITIIDIVVVLGLCLLTIDFILFSSFSIKYVFYEDRLLVRGSFFRSRIPYEEITRISLATEIFTGYRLLSSKNAIEIFYKSAILGSVKISPKDSELFISEIKKRCPKVQIDL